MKIIKELQRVQQEHGYLSDERLHEVADRLAVPLYKIEDVARFFPHFRSEPPPQVELHICNTMTCALRGSRDLLAWAQSECGKRIAPGSNGKQPAKLTISGVPCLGQCDHAPAALLYDHDSSHSAEHEPPIYAQIKKEDISKLIEECANGRSPQGPAHEPTINTNMDQWKIDPYQNESAKERYRAIKQFFKDVETRRVELETSPDERDRAQKEIEPHWAAMQEDRGQIESRNAEVPTDSTIDHPRLLQTVRSEPSVKEIAMLLAGNAVIAALQEAGLLGMGGAGGRAYKKWNDVRNARGKRKYIVCNADESEPGTFKDRELLLRFPYLLIESMVLAGLVVGAERGYIYVRHEFEPQIHALRREIAEAVAKRACGDNILGSGSHFHLEVVTSPGGYICGEQTALIEVLEDKRSEPRNRPPELQTNGLWDMPTLLHNVETLSWVPAILLNLPDEITADPDSPDRNTAGRWYAEQGKAPSQGRRFFSISGDVKQPGVYEVAIGTTLGELIGYHAGGMLEDREVKALALSGPSAGFLPRFLPCDALPEDFVKTLPAGSDTFDLLEMTLDIKTSRIMKVMLGAGIVVYAEGADLVSQAVACSEFYRDESCGKCVPCRLGSKQMADWAKILHQRRFDSEECTVVHDQVKQLGEVMQLTSICGLGAVAAAPLQTLLDYFPNDVKQYLS